MNLLDANKIFLIGIGGAGMRGLAYLLQNRGAIVGGSDIQHDALLNELDMSEYQLVAENNAEGPLSKSDLVIYSDAVEKSHALRKYANNLGIRQLSYPQAVGELSVGMRTIAIAGTHGKSSTTALLAHILIAAGKDPSVLIGAAVPAWGNFNARVGSSDIFVIEADEYRNHYLEIKPQSVIVTSIDFDHPDYFNSIEDVEKSFSSFLARVPSDGYVLTTDQVLKAHPAVKWPSFVKTISNPLSNLKLVLPGDHMKLNATLAVVLAEDMGVSKAKAIKALESFGGLSRRFEKIGSLGELEIYSDYGHHPLEIELTFKAAREYFDGKRILVIFEPHTQDRFERFFTDFVDALKKADGVLLSPIFYVKGREPEPSRSSAELMPNFEKEGVPVWYLDDYSKLNEKIADVGKGYDVVLAFSAGILDRKLRELL